MPSEPTLKFPFIKKGWTHELVRREGAIAVVGRHKKGIPMHFEVVRLREDPEHVWQRGGKEIHVPTQERYPRSEEWGTYGFTYRAFPEALQKFEAMKGMDSS